MTVEFRPLKAGHLETILAQPAQQLEQAGMIVPGFEQRLVSGAAMGAWVGPRIVGAAGVVPLWPGELAVAWCLLSSRAGRYMLAITRKCREVLDADPTTRIEMYVNSDVGAGERWAVAMGFVRETDTPLRKRGRGGKDQHVYARVR